MKKIAKAVINIIVLLGILFAAYRIFMLNLNVCIDENNAVYIGIFEHYDVYDPECIGN